LKRLVLIALGGAFGAVARYAVASVIGRSVSTVFPVGTLVVNASGSLAIGFVYELASSFALPPAFRELTAIGFLGAYTTFSTLAFETTALLRDNELWTAAGYTAASIASGVMLCYAGMFLARLLARAL
jgi:fluoride exporter